MCNCLEEQRKRLIENKDKISELKEKRLRGITVKELFETQ